MFARATHAYGYCDICNLRCDLADLKFEVENGVKTKRRACPECWSPDHPQNFVGRLRINDPQSLRDARPEVGIEQSRSFFGWNPVGHELTYATLSLGDVTVTTS